MSYREKDKSISEFSPEDLIAGFRNGSPDVMNAIYEEYFVKLCHYSKCFVGDPLDAQDIVSTVFERLLTVHRSNREIGKRLTNPCDLANYLYVAVKNESLVFLDSTKRRKRREERFEKEYTRDDELDLEYLRGLRDQKLLETIYKLDQRSIQALRKIYFENMTYEEVAREMAISRATVSNLRAQGINILAKILSREDIIMLFIIILLL